jgi:hypothetical protein
MTSHDAEPTQETQPAKGEPVVIPVPEKAEMMAALRKAAKVARQPRDPQR